jgi:hypothetical protein
VINRVYLWPVWWTLDFTQWIVGLIWIALVIGVLAAERRRRKRKVSAPSAEPTCPTCGYVVIGLAGSVCPECGSDLSSIGVIRPDANQTAPLARITLWTIVFALSAFLVWREVRPRLPVWNESTSTHTFSGPLSGAYKSIEVRRGQRWWQWPRRRGIVALFDRFEFRLQRLDNSQPVYIVEQPPLTAAEHSAYVQRLMATTSPRDYPEVFDRRALLEWMRTQGVNRADTAVQAEVDEIGVEVDRRSGGFRRWAFARPTVVVQTAYTGRPWWLYAVCAAVALVIWLIGARVAARRRTLPYERTALPQPA